MDLDKLTGGEGDTLANALVGTLLNAVPGLTPDELEKFLSANVQVEFSIMELASINALSVMAQHWGDKGSMVTEAAVMISDKINAAVESQMDRLRKELLGE